MPLEEKVEQLEREIRALKDYINLESKRVRINQPLVVRGDVSLYDGQVYILAGTGNPDNTVDAPQGSIFLRLDGAAGTTVYAKYGTSNADWESLT